MSHLSYKNKMKKINELAQLFAKYKIYPKSCYNDCSPARVFQRMFPENHYSKDLETFLSCQNYKSTQRGADLPWWSKSFFTEELDSRVLIISQDSLSKDAKSIVFFAHLMPVINNEYRYKEYVDQLNGKRSFSFKNSWNKVRKQLIEWNIDFDFLYITDASKVYKKGSLKDKDFDRGKNKELLESEIEFCNPDLIILLGEQPLNLLYKTKSYSSVVEGGKSILVKGKKCVVAPFFIGQGRTQKNFKGRLEIATNLIRKEILKHRRKN